MADGGGGAASPSSSSRDYVTGITDVHDKHPSSFLDGAFLLRLLQTLPQTTPSTFPFPLPPNSPPRHHHDPAVAAFGPSRPFLPPNFLSPSSSHPPPPSPSAAQFPEPLPFPPPSLSVPPVLWSPPPGFPPLGANATSSYGTGNGPLFWMDDQRLGFSAPHVGPLAAARPSSGLYGIPGPDRVLVDRTESCRKVSGSRGPEERNDLRPHRVFNFRLAVLLYWTEGWLARASPELVRHHGRRRLRGHVGTLSGTVPMERKERVPHFRYQVESGSKGQHCVLHTGHRDWSNGSLCIRGKMGIKRWWEGGRRVGVTRIYQPQSHPEDVVSQKDFRQDRHMRIHSDIPVKSQLKS